MSRSSQTDLEYIKRLKNCIQAYFYFYVKPENVLHVFHQYNSKLLTQIDMENISKLTDSNGSTQGAILLLDRLCLYPEFYDTLLKVLRDPMVKLEHVAEKMETKKSQMDNEIKDEQRSHEEEVTKLRQEIRLKAQHICDLERQKEELYQMTERQKCELAIRDQMDEEQRRQLEEKIMKLTRENQAKDQLIQTIGIRRNQEENKQLRRQKQEHNQPFWILEKFHYGIKIFMIATGAAAGAVLDLKNLNMYREWGDLQTERNAKGI